MKVFERRRGLNRTGCHIKEECFSYSGNFCENGFQIIVVCDNGEIRQRSNIFWVYTFDKERGYYWKEDDCDFKGIHCCCSSSSLCAFFRKEYYVKGGHRLFFIGGANMFYGDKEKKFTSSSFLLYELFRMEEEKEEEEKEKSKYQKFITNDQDRTLQSEYFYEFCDDLIFNLFFQKIMKRSIDDFFVAERSLDFEVDTAFEPDCGVYFGVPFHEEHREMYSFLFNRFQRKKGNTIDIQHLTPSSSPFMEFMLTSTDFIWNGQCSESRKNAFMFHQKVNTTEEKMGKCYERYHKNLRSLILDMYRMKNRLKQKICDSTEQVKEYLSAQVEKIHKDLDHLELKTSQENESVNSIMNDLFDTLSGKKKEKEERTILQKKILQKKEQQQPKEHETFFSTFVVDWERIFIFILMCLLFMFLILYLQKK